MLVPYVVFFLVSYFGNALANTEIVNFRASHIRVVPPSSALLSHAVTLHPSNHERLVERIPAQLGTPLEHVCHASEPGVCENELWLALDLDNEEWSKYNKYTLRVSWPASSPTDFRIDIHTPSDLPSHLTAPLDSSDTYFNYTRSTYARIRLVDSGIRPPSHPLRSPTKPVTFVITLEPLVLGVIPESIIPTLGLLGILLPLTFIIARSIHAGLAHVATDARREIASFRHKAL